MVGSRRVKGAESAPTARRVLSLTDALTRRRVVGLGRPMVVSADTIAASESATVGLDPCVAGIRDENLEAVEIPQLVVLVVAEPDKEGIDQAVATGARRLLMHPADGLHGDPEPYPVIVPGKLGAEPEGLSDGFPVGVEPRQDSRATGPVLAHSFDDDLRNDRRSVGHGFVPSLPSDSFTIREITATRRWSGLRPSASAATSRSRIAAGGTGRARRWRGTRCMPTGGGSAARAGNGCCGSGTSYWNGPTRISTKPAGCAASICAGIPTPTRSCVTSTSRRRARRPGSSATYDAAYRPGASPGGKPRDRNTPKIEIRRISDLQTLGSHET